MFDTGETLEDIEEWAEATFPHEFKAVKDYLYENEINALDWDHEDARTHVLVDCVHVGHLGPRHGRPVIAHVTFHETQPEPWVVLCEPNAMDKCTYNAICRHDTHFDEPFCWLDPRKDCVGNARFDALIQFVYLFDERSVGASIDVHQFKKHFEGACRVIAGKLEEQRRQNGKCKWCFYYSAMAQL
jgi:hypothetical protein